MPLPYTAPAAPEAGLRLRSRRSRGSRSRRPNVWLLLTLVSLLALMLMVSAASTGATWTVHGPGFSVVLPGVRIH